MFECGIYTEFLGYLTGSLLKLITPGSAHTQNLDVHFYYLLLFVLNVNRL